jgi:hypothetical protein
VSADPKAGQKPPSAPRRMLFDEQHEPVKYSSNGAIRVSGFSAGSDLHETVTLLMRGGAMSFQYEMTTDEAVAFATLILRAASEVEAAR